MRGELAKGARVRKLKCVQIEGDERGLKLFVFGAFKLQRRSLDV